MRVSAIAAPERMAAKPAGGAAAATEADIKAKLKYLVGKVRGLVLYFIKAKWRKWCSVRRRCVCARKGAEKDRGEETREKRGGRRPPCACSTNQPPIYIRTHRHNMHTQ